MVFTCLFVWRMVLINSLALKDKESLRLDKWLWAARLCKTRVLARTMINGGKVKYNHQRVKPSRQVAIGDFIEITDVDHKRELLILEINAMRRPYPQACLMYQETTASLTRRQKKHQMHDMRMETSPRRSPSKADRRKLRAMKTGG